MKQSTEIYESGLSATFTDECSQKIKSYALSRKLSGREAIRYALTAEEILLNAAEEGSCEKVSLTLGKRFSRSRIVLELTGRPFNAFQSASAGSILGDSILKNLGLTPEYYYENGANTYLFKIKKQPLNPIAKLLLVLGCCVLFGFAGKSFFPPALLNGLQTNVLTPAHDIFMNLLGCIAGPMIFFSVAWGIYGIGDAATLKKTGKKLLSAFIRDIFIITVLCAAVVIPLFNPAFSVSGVDLSEGSSLVDMLIGLVPKNLFSPFVEGSTLQVIFLAVALGTAMLLLDKKLTAVARALEELNRLFQYFTELINRLIPVFIFSVVTGLIWEGSSVSLSGFGKYLAVSFLCFGLLFIAFPAVTGLRMKVSPFLLIKKGLPTFLTACSTASSAAAFGTNMNACKNSYGIHDTVASFGLPLGIVAFKPASAVYYTTLSVFFALLYHMEISPSWIIMTVLFAVILSVAVLPIPGGALASYTVLFSQLGIPSEAIAVALAFDTLLDFVITGTNQFILPLSVLQQADALGMVDRKILISPTAGITKDGTAQDP